MTKPHEQEWKQGASRWSIRDAATGAERAHVFTDDQSATEADAVVALITAAPAAIRALIKMAAKTDDSDGLPCWCRGNRARHSPVCVEARSALRKAGVLP